jgi:sRNA-binding protein
LAQARRRDLKNGLRPVPSRGPASKFLGSGQKSTSTGKSTGRSMSNNSHSVDTQDHKPPPLSEKKVPAVLACLSEWFPQAFVPEKYLPHRPLKIGIHVDLEARCPALSERERGAVLHWYVTRATYLRACVAGAPRIDLDGTVCGKVTAAEAQHAAARLAEILAARASKQELIESRAAAKPAAPRKKEKPLEEKPPAPQRDGLAALREAAKRRRVTA